MTDKNYLRSLRQPTPENPLRILVSACFVGTLCGYDGTDNGNYPSVQKLMQYNNVRLIPFCPEHFSFGTPRAMCNIHGGTGIDVLEGRAKVLTEDNIDWTDGMIRAAEKMLQVAQEHNIELAVLMDISAACGSQVIYDGHRFIPDKKYQIGAGVAAANLLRNGFKVISQRDYAALEILYSRIDPAYVLDAEAIDQDQTDWYKSYFGH